MHSRTTGRFWQYKRVHTAHETMTKILLYMKLFTQLTINGFNYLPSFVNPPLGLIGDMLFLVASGCRYQIDTVNFLPLVFDLFANIGLYALSLAYFGKSTE